MTYLYEYKILDDNIKVEYTFSSVSDGIKVIDMWVDDKPHSVNWMGPEARAKLMDRLEADMEDSKLKSPIEFSIAPVRRIIYKLTPHLYAYI